jgi:hypothetical protein
MQTGDNYRYRLEKTIALLYDYHRQRFQQISKTEHPVLFHQKNHTMCIRIGYIACGRFVKRGSFSGSWLLFFNIERESNGAIS